jgi:integrase
MNDTNPSEKITILDDKVHVFMREGSPFWWCGFHFKGKYIRTTTKQKHLEAAKAFAKDWYFSKQTEIASGEIASPKHEFGKLAEEALANYKTMFVDRGQRSLKTYIGIEGILNSRVKDYFKKVAVQNIDNTAWHKYKEDMVALYPNIKRGTLHQYKNAIRMVLNYAYRQGILKQLPQFKDEYDTTKNTATRAWFTKDEYSKLHNSIRKHADYLETRDKLQHQHARELYDYVIFGTNTGMRVGELNACRFCDVRIVVEKLTDKKILVISNIKGKRGVGNCQSFYGAVDAFLRIVKRRGLTLAQAKESTEKLFLVHHRVMFNNILEKKKLKMTNTNPPTKRDFVSLRSTYICFRLLHGAPIYEIANNCRTSVKMIQDHYAKHLGGQLMPNINRIKFDSWESESPKKKASATAKKTSKKSTKISSTKG